MARHGSRAEYSAVSTHGDDGDIGSIFELETIRSSSSRHGGDINVVAAVVARNAELWYKAGKPVLSGLDMTVPSGSIYALLGSSGCGKTSLLNCIVGNQRLNKGSVWVFGEKPGTKGIGVPGRNVGYMPQELSLYDEFSVWETLNYFGRFSGMTEEQVGTEFKVFANLLDLPPFIRRVGTLSGGQKRRVSFAVAMIHNPQLLILDEPTVGVDPLLCQQIWTYLAKLVVRHHTTVIITTHYIEEARRANMIGVIRNGKMLAERTPQEFLDYYASDEVGSLEKAVLKLCREDSTRGLESSQTETPKRRPSSRRRISGWDTMTRKKLTVQNSEEVKMASVANESDESGFSHSVVRIKALARKNVVVLIRNLALLIFVVLIPATEMIFIGLCFGYEPKNLQIGVVNYEMNNTVCSKPIPQRGKCDWNHLSCEYLSQVPKDSVELVTYNLEQDAEEAVHSGKIWGYLRIPKDFSFQLHRSVVLGTKVDEGVLDARKIIGTFDVTNKFITATIKTTLYKALSNFTSRLLSNCGIDPRRKQSSLVYKGPIYGKEDTDMRDYSSPSMAAAAMWFFPIISIGLRFIEERECGVLSRSLVAGVRTWEIMVAYLLSEFFIILAQSLLVLLVLIFISEIEILGSRLLVFSLFVFVGYSGVSLGFLLGYFCREKIEVDILALSSIMPNALLCGIFWPVQGLPEFLQNVAAILPCTLPSEAIRSIISRGWGLSHYNVWGGFMVTALYIVVFNLLLIILFKTFKK